MDIKVILLTAEPDEHEVETLNKLFKHMFSEYERFAIDVRDIREGAIVIQGIFADEIIFIGSKDSFTDEVNWQLENVYTDAIKIML